MISVEAPSRDDLDLLADALRDAGCDPGPISQRGAGTDLHLDPTLLDHEMWRLMTVLAGGAGSGAGKALATWALEMVRQRRDPEPPVIVKVRGQKVVLRTPDDRAKLVAALDAVQD
jgi:hypothetical protein